MKRSRTRRSASLLRLQMAIGVAAVCALHIQAAGAPFQVRAIWIGPQHFTSRAVADATLDRCQQAGFNVVLPDVMINQSVAFKSTQFAGRVLATDDFDPLEYLVEGAHKRRMKIEAWCCVYYEGAGGAGKPPLFPDRLVRTMSGLPFEQRFLSPSIPGVNEYLQSVFAELSPYDIDGIHLDYIRYPGTTFDYSVAGREAFRKDIGFDPLDFLDHADLLLAGQKEPYPIRVLFPRDHAEKPWETTEIERTLDQSQLGYAFVSESPERIAQLQSPGLLVVSSYYRPAEEMVAALSKFVRRGGDLLWTDAPAAGLGRSPRLRSLLGLNEAVWKGNARVSLAAAVDSKFSNAIPSRSFTTASSYELIPGDGVVQMSLADGAAAVTMAERGGRAIVVGPHLMKSKSAEAAAMIASLIETLRDGRVGEATATLAEKRKAWVQWRGDRVTQVVQAVHDIAQVQEPPICVSSSGGPSPVEFYACYRDARRWLAEGLNEHVFPMNYTDDPDELSDILRTQTAATPAGRQSSVYPGLQAYRRATVDGAPQVASQDPAVLRRQLELVRDHGYEGFAIFAYNVLSDELVDVVREFAVETPDRLNATSQPLTEQAK